METSSIVVTVIILLLLGIILFTYFYSPDWFVEIAPGPDPLKPSAKIVGETFISTPLVDSAFNLKRPVMPTTKN